MQRRDLSPLRGEVTCVATTSDREFGSNSYRTPIFGRRTCLSRHRSFWRAVVVRFFWYDDVTLCKRTMSSTVARCWLVVGSPGVAKLLVSRPEGWTSLILGKNHNITPMKSNPIDLWTCIGCFSRPMTPKCKRHRYRLATPRNRYRFLPRIRSARRCG